MECPMDAQEFPLNTASAQIAAGSDPHFSHKSNSNKIKQFFYSTNKIIKVFATSSLPLQLLNCGRGLSSRYSKPVIQMTRRSIFAIR